MNTKILLNLGVVITVLCLSCTAVAQSDVALATRKAELQALSARLHKRDENNRRQAQEYARRVGIPVRRELPNGQVLELQRIDPDTGPVFYITNNLDAADTVSTDEVRPGGSAGLNLEGYGMTVAEWDAGAIYAHTDFIGRLTQMDDATEVKGHSTHVAGTLIGAGDGLEPRSRGMAYAAHLNAYDWNSDTAEMATAAAGGLLVSNHSYGIAAGWLYMGGAEPDEWWWIGGAADTDVEDPNFGYYDTESRLWDQIAYDAPYYLIVKAAGNDRSETGPAPGRPYRIIDQDGSFVSISTEPRNPDCAPAGYDCLPTHSVAKNILTVGAVDDIPGGYSPLSGPSSVLMSPFSSWGPTDDGRIKPDVVGNGVFLISAWHESPFYAAAAGTSMAAPNVTGSLLLLQEHYENVHGAGNFMRSATLKALAIHTADEAGSADGPDYEFGWGLLNTKNAARVITEDGGDHQIIEDSLADSAVDSVQISVTQENALVTATLVWMDRPGTVVTPALDPQDLMLVNDLDLRIKTGSTTYMPWVLNPAVPAAAASTGDNFRDNVEQVEVSGGGTGIYTIEVSHKAILFNGENQDYTLIISVNTALPTGSGLLIDENFTGGLPAGWSVATDMGISWTIKTPVPGDSRLDNLTGGSGQFAMVDNAYAYETVTSLRTPVMDLSANNAAVLRFKSAYWYDFLESLNVDSSTDGGNNWSNLWKWQGFNPFPTQYALDLSAAIAGQPSVMLRFRFDSEGWINGDYWQIDDVQLEVFGGDPPPGDPPGQASGPNPVDGASGLGIETDLSWSAGTAAISHDVYFGTNSTPNGGDFQGNQGGTGFDPGTLANETTYYWRIDEVNADGTTTGLVWSFNTEAAPVLPGPAIDPNPANGATGISTSVSLGWTAGTDTDSHDVYFGSSTTPAFQGNQAGTGFDPGTLANGTTYYWRIDEVNGDGTTMGAVWSFTTAAVAGSSFHIASISVTGEKLKAPRYRGVATILVEDAGGAPVDGVAVSGTFSGDWSGTQSGTTDINGQLIVVTPEVKNGADWNFCVDSASKTDWDFDQVKSAAFMCGASPPPATTGSIAGVITDNSNDNPVQGATASADSGQSDTTDAAGNYTLLGVPTGTRIVTVSATGFDSASPETLVEDGLTSALNASLTPSAVGGGTGVLKGTVLSSTGAKLGGVQVQVVGGPSATTNGGGKYSIQNVPEGLQTVTASHASAGSFEGTVTIVAGSTVTLNINLSLNP